MESRKELGKEWKDGCGEECSGGHNRAPVFWALLVVLFGLLAVFEFGLKNIKSVPEWIHSFGFWRIFAFVIGFAIIISGLRMPAKRK